MHVASPSFDGPPPFLCPRQAVRRAMAKVDTFLEAAACKAQQIANQMKRRAAAAGEGAAHDSDAGDADGGSFPGDYAECEGEERAHAASDGESGASQGASSGSRAAAGSAAEATALLSAPRPRLFKTPWQAPARTAADPSLPARTPLAQLAANEMAQADTSTNPGPPKRIRALGLGPRRGFNPPRKAS